MRPCRQSPTDGSTPIHRRQATRAAATAGRFPHSRLRTSTAERPAGDRWLLLGDAAGLVDPITREGIFFAVRSGLLAAEALQRPDPSGTYTAAVRDGIHRELARASQLRNAFFQPRFTSLLVDALARSPAIAAVMIDLIAGRQLVRGPETSTPGYVGDRPDDQASRWLVEGGWPLYPPLPSGLRHPAQSTTSPKYPSRARTVTSARLSRTVIARHCSSPGVSRRDGT